MIYELYPAESRNLASPSLDAFGSRLPRRSKKRIPVLLVIRQTYKSGKVVRIICHCFFADLPHATHVKIELQACRPLCVSGWLSFSVSVWSIYPACQPSNQDSRNSGKTKQQTVLMHPNSAISKCVQA